MSKSYPISEGWVTVRVHLQRNVDGRKYTDTELKDLVGFLTGGNPEEFEFAQKRRYKTRIVVTYRRQSATKQTS